MSRGYGCTPEFYLCLDVAALRHTEHIANSGWCGCSRDFALRQMPKKPETVQEMYELLKQCHESTVEERFMWSHMLLPGEDVPRAPSMHCARLHVRPQPWHCCSRTCSSSCRGGKAQ